VPNMLKVRCLSWRLHVCGSFTKLPVFVASILTVSKVDKLHPSVLAFGVPHVTRVPGRLVHKLKRSIQQLSQQIKV
jgi:hypothetical protein